MPAKMRWNLATVASIASIVGIPLAIIQCYYSSSSSTPETVRSTEISSHGAESPIVNAGRDASLNAMPRSNAKETPTRGSRSGKDAGSQQNGDITLQSGGDNSPVVNAGRDAIVNLATPKPDFITDHDGAGALLMTDPDFRAFIGAAIDAKGDKIIGRLINGTPLSLIEQREDSQDEPSPPWAKVKVLDGPHKGREGWILLNSLRKPQ